ncbi:MAG: TonB-dependent receptor [Puia sp.]|nr:TonB-dependent receptor [Puia sp.]
MRKIFVLTTLVFLFICLAAFSQRVTIVGTNLSLKQVFSSLKKQSGFNFFYSYSLLKNTKPVTLNIRDGSMKDVLEACFADQPVSYKIEQNTIFIKAKNAAPATAPATDPATSSGPRVFPDNSVGQSAGPELTRAILVSGRVTDSLGSPLAGASVNIVGSSRGTVTDKEGRYSLSVPEGSSLVFSYVGYEPHTELPQGRSVIDVILHRGALGLNDVVVVGFGTQKKTNVTGAVGTVNVQEVLGDRPVSSLPTLLQGVVPGLQVTLGTGQPGATGSLNIRGGTDINTSGNTINSGAPLILVDNVPFNGPLNLLNLNDIETVTVLKDAGSAAIYGARSAFGVVLITMKKGVKNRAPQFFYDDNFTLSSAMDLPKKASPIQTVQSLIDMGTTAYWSGQNTSTWMQLMQNYQKNPSLYPQGYALSGGIRYQLAQTDVIRNLLGTASLQQMHNFAVSGGSDKSYYRLSLGTTNETGVIDPGARQDYFKRYTLRSSLSSDIASWITTQLEAGYSYSYQATPFYDAFLESALLPSFTPIQDTMTIGGTVYPFGTPKNIVGLTAPITTRYDDIRLTGRVIVRPFAGFSVTGEYTFDNLRELYNSYDKQYAYAEPSEFTNVSGGTSTFLLENYLTDYNALNVYGNYQKAFGDHHLSLTAGFNQETDNYQENQVQRTQMIVANLPSISQATGPTTGGDSYSAYALRGYFGRVAYDYRNKYLLQINSRYDGSSNFPPGNQWGFFPSASAGWRISQEEFMRSLRPWLQELKLRGSLGQVGNQNIPPYSFIPGMTGYYSSWLNGGAQVTTLQPPGLVSNNFTWETIQTADLGLDFGLLKNQLTGSLDYYDRKTKNILYNGIQLPGTLGTTSPLQNAAALDSKGFELVLDWKGRIGAVTYRIGGNLYDFQSRITKVQNTAGLLSQYYSGEKMGEIWGYTTQRLYQVSDFVAGSLGNNLTGGTLLPGVAKVQGSNPNPGDVLYKDLDGNGIINPGSGTLSNHGDERIIGNSTQRYQYGIRGGVSYRGFDFSFVLRGVGKSQTALVNPLTFPNEYAFGTIYSHELNYWTPANTGAFFGRLYNQAAGNQSFNEYTQTRFLQNAAFLKVSNLALAYNLPDFLLRRAHIEKLRVFFSMENPFLLINHFPRGMDPETAVSPVDSQGLSYPYLRKSSVGVNLSF